MFLSRNKNNKFYPPKNPLLLYKSGFKGVKIIFMFSWWEGEIRSKTSHMKPQTHKERRIAFGTVNRKTTSFNRAKLNLSLHSDAATITEICSLHRVLYLICEIPQWNTYNKTTVWSYKAKERWRSEATAQENQQQDHDVLEITRSASRKHVYIILTPLNRTFI